MRWPIYSTASAAGGGFILLTGEVGTGKTTINRCLLEQLPDTTDLAIILNPALSAVELLASACDELSIDYPAGTQSLKALTDALHRYLLENYERGRRTVLMIDEAQHLDFNVLEQIRLLTNLETNDEKLLQIILIGQPELTEKLSRPELRQLNQRITARYNLQPLNFDETAAYIKHRLEVAGLKGGVSLFETSAVRRIHNLTRGIPRLINVLCDRSLLGAYGQKKSRVTRLLVRDAASEVFGEVADKSLWRRVLVPAVLGAVLVLVLVVAWLFWASGPSGLVDKTSLNKPVAPSTATDTAVIDVSEPIIDQSPVTWTFSPDAGRERLWLLASDVPSPGSVCPPPPMTGIRCSEGVAAVWNDIASLNRPVLLEMVTPQRFAESVLVLRFEGVEAILWSDQGLVSAPLSDLAPTWTGRYQYLWQPPRGWMGPIGLGDSGPVVAEVAQMFATLDGVSLTTISQFGDALATRVRLFQGAEGLVADGVVGEQTLLRLNDRLNVGLTTTRALQRAQRWQESP
ncbi:AAA family ATPase [Luminiphilus sp.]|nr:AAA family ATPase [Luminiphilus sp.]